MVSRGRLPARQFAGQGRRIDAPRTWSGEIEKRVPSKSPHVRWSFHVASPRLSLLVVRAVNEVVIARGIQSRPRYSAQDRPFPPVASEIATLCGGKRSLFLTVIGAGKKQPPHQPPEMSRAFANARLCRPASPTSMQARPVLEQPSLPR
jgi:hypothetical protein